MRRKEGLVIGLLGVAVGLLIVLTLQLNSVPAAQGQTAAGADSGWLMATGLIAGNSSACWIFNTKDGKLVMYKSQGTSLQLVATRLTTFDFQVVQYGVQKPTVVDMQRESKKKR